MIAAPMAAAGWTIDRHRMTAYTLDSVQQGRDKAV